MHSLTRSCFCEWRGAWSSDDQAQQEMLCSRLQQRAWHFTCSMTGVFFPCKRQQLGDPNELGAQQEIVWIKSSFVAVADASSASSRHDYCLDGLKMWQVLSAWKFVMLDPKQRQTKACQIGIAYRCVGCLSSKITESFLLKIEKNEKQFSRYDWNAQSGLIAFTCNKTME